MPDTPRVIAISGKAGSGKSSIAKEAYALLRQMGYAPCLVSFAEPVKSTSKEVLVALGLIDRHAPEVEWKAKYRKVPQALGVHLRNYNTDIWVDLAMWRIRHAMTLSDRVVVLNDDCRFENEAFALRGLGGALVRVTTDAAVRRRRLRESIDENHSSETGLDHFRGWDLELVQTGPEIPPAKAYAIKMLAQLGFQHPQQSTLDGLDPDIQGRIEDAQRHNTKV